MKTNQEIIKEAKESYEKHFKDAQAKPNPRSEDVMIDKAKLTQKVNDMKLAEEKEHESLKVLRKKLEESAEESLEKTFGND